ncbi:MAG TPA: N-methyl-L-tryptophan oxidase, partial [Chitinophagaceae bacterium]
LEQFSIPNDKSSHGGQSRIIRKAYFEHPDYVPLLERAYHNWKHIEEKAGQQLYFKTGLVYTGPADHTIIKGVKKAASLYNVDIENISQQEMGKRFPQIVIESNSSTIFEPDAGFLLPGKAIDLYTKEAVKLGAVIHSNEKTLEWKKENGSIKVVTDKNVYTTKKLVVTAGAWMTQLLTDLPVQLNVTRQILIWVKPKDPQAYSLNNFPCWMIATEKLNGVYYGFPYLDAKIVGEPPGLKFAIHYPASKTDPDSVNREVSSDEIKDVINGVKEHLPAANSEVVASKVCLYTNTPDEDFIIDHLPGYDSDVCFASACSGHGFKFASVIGEILADLTIDGATKLPVEFLRLKRFENQSAIGNEQ